MNQPQSQDQPDRLQRLFRLAGTSAEGRYLLELMWRYRGLAPL